MDTWNILLSLLKNLDNYYDGFEEIIQNTVKYENEQIRLIDYIDLKHIKTTNEALWYAINIKYKTI